MDRLSVYKTYVEFSDGSGEKAHPVIILANTSTELSLEKYVLAVILSKKNSMLKASKIFTKKFCMNLKMLKLQDLIRV